MSSENIQSKYILVKTDGYEIEINKFDNENAARTAMADDYNNILNNNPDMDDVWLDQSYCNNTDAILYNNGDNVFVWKIAKI